MSNSPSGKGPAAAAAQSGANPRIPSDNIDYEASTALAQDKIKKCQRLISMARYIRDQIVFQQRSAGLYPSAEDGEDLAAIKRQCRDLLDGNFLEGISGSLTENLQGEAETELRRLDLLGNGEKVVEARKKWKEVLGLVGEWENVKAEVEEAVAGLQ